MAFVMLAVATGTLGFAGSAAAASAADIRRETEIHPGVIEVEFSSHVLGAERRFCVTAGTTVQPGTGGWPVLFLLHGRGRTHRSLVDVEPMRRAFRAAPFCVVFPQGDDGWYIDSPVAPESRYEAYLEEVMALAGRIRPLVQSREHRAISGWSMGGYGAMRFAQRHPQEFGVVATIIGLLDFPRAANLPAGRNYSVPVARFGSDPAAWAQFNPLREAESLRRHRVLIVTATDAFDRTMNEHFHARLRALNIPHQFLVLPGAHTFDLVQEAVPRVLDFVTNAFNSGGPAGTAQPLRPAP